MVVKRKVRQDRIALDVDPDCQAHTHTNNENSTSCRKCDSSATFCQDKLCDADGIMHEMQQMHEAKNGPKLLQIMFCKEAWIGFTFPTKPNLSSVRISVCILGAACKP